MALTDRDEDNLIISLYAAQLGLSKVITKSNRQNYNRIAQAVGLDSIISPSSWPPPTFSRWSGGCRTPRAA